jgi:hypothetical protein
MLACSEDLEADVKMYEAMFGAESSEEWEGCRSISLGNTKLYIMSAPKAAPIMVVQVEDIRAEIERLRKEGFEAMDPFEVQAGIFTFYQDKTGTQYGLLQTPSE